MSAYKDYFYVSDFVVRGFFEDYRFLSNFHLHVVRYEDDWYPSTEHAYQAAKTLDLNARKPYMVNGGYSCRDAQREGQKLEKRDDWDEVKYYIMLQLVEQKFQNPELRAKLLATGDKFLEETNHWGDNIWGRDYRCDYGTNWLGDILMRVRNLYQPPPK